MESVIDTNILVYATVEDSLFHEECLKKLNELSKIYFPPTVIEEFVLVLRELGISEDFIRKQVKVILEDPKVKVLSLNSKDLKDAIEILGREKVSTRRFNDKLILLSAKKNRLPIYTYDKKLREQSKKMGIELL